MARGKSSVAIGTIQSRRRIWIRRTMGSFTFTACSGWLGGHWNRKRVYESKAHWDFRGGFAGAVRARGGATIYNAPGRRSSGSGRAGESRGGTVEDQGGNYRQRIHRERAALDER